MLFYEIKWTSNLYFLDIICSVNEVNKKSALDSIEELRKRTIESVSLQDSDDEYDRQFTIFDSEKRSNNLFKKHNEELYKLDFGLAGTIGTIFFQSRIFYNDERFSEKIVKDLKNNKNSYICFLLHMPSKIRSFAFETQYHAGTPLWYTALENMMIYYDEIISSPDFLNFINIYEKSREIFETCRDTFDPDSRNFDDWNHFRSTTKNLLRNTLKATFDFYLENIENGNLTFRQSQFFDGDFDKNKLYNYIQIQKEVSIKNIDFSWYPINKTEISPLHFRL